MKLFGTDGIRGTFGIYPLDEATIRKIGSTISSIYSKKINKIFIAHDGRLSHEVIGKNLIEGILSTSDIEIIFLDLLPTPSIPYILSERDEEDAMGIQITASHNPYMDNGLKIFNSDGFKISSIEEDKIEEILYSIEEVKYTNDLTVIKNSSYTDSYVKYLSNTFDHFVDKSKKIHIALDCANGALSKIIKTLNLHKNISFSIFNDNPNGKNINDNCGAVYPEYLSNTITQRNKEIDITDDEWIDFGITFDGDGDRAILISESGRVIDGDEILFILSGTETSEILVGTNMTNFGIRESIEKKGHSFIETNVGDKFLLDAILKNNAYMGSESSGHIIHTDVCKIPIGDAMITLIKIIHTLQFQNLSVDEYYPKSLKIPSKLFNIETKDPTELIENNHSKFEKVREILSEDGRILVRESGTQSMVRILIEHKSPDILDKAEEIIKRIL